MAQVRPPHGKRRQASTRRASIRCCTLRRCRAALRRHLASRAAGGGQLLFQQQAPQHGRHLLALLQQLRLLDAALVAEAAQVRIKGLPGGGEDVQA